ncbi:methionine ABC transporter ATP-binding protein [Bifidobacterium choerinum]|uniref:ABC transporter ATP-binding protein n=1 Tax=Bifidobacterium choerinum TaxID=35760 RepID=A0A087AA03_9BIFI|nr:ATP-binding cassette domain-containing protein [Bifidobacterium choerinum]KFI55603.1 ABC transporter ATP-binding protein [Bifidobacterium choerinum]
MTDIITLDDVSVVFESDGRSVEAVSHASVHIEEGEIFGIIGFSGAGKSTLVRTINLLERPTSGRVVIDGRDVTALRGTALRKLRSGIGFVFQSFNLIDNVTVAQNIAFALKAAHVPKSRHRARIEELLRLVGLEEKIDSYPSQLSGGQRQRVSIARALANHPRILLCDEATSALDPETTEGILALLKRVNAELGVTIVFITHQFDVAKAIFDHVAVMEHGVIVEQGTTFDVFGSPHHETTRALVERYLGVAIPRRLVPQLPSGRLIELRYKDEGALEPLISDVSRHFEVSINVLHGNVGYFGTQAIGTLIVLVSARQEGQRGAFVVQAAIDELTSRVADARELSVALNDDIGASIDAIFADDAYGTRPSAHAADAYDGDAHKEVLA